MSTEAEPQHSESAVEPPGRRLRQAREAAGMDQNDVAAELRLGVDTIDALERDAVERLPAPIFVRGYLRNYAALVGLPPEELVEAYSASAGHGHTQGPVAGPVQQQLVGARRRTYLVWLLVLVVAIAVGWWFQQRTATPPTVPDQQEALEAARSDSTQGPDDMAATPYVEDATPQPRGLPSAAEPVTPPPDDVPPEVADEPQSTAPAPEQQSEPESAAAEPETPPVAQAAPLPAPPAEPQTAPAAQGDTLKLTFEDRSWVEVRDATGTRLLYRLANAGETRTLQGRAPFRVVLGNAPAVKMELNGSQVDVAARTRGRTARFSIAP